MGIQGSGVVPDLEFFFCDHWIGIDPKEDVPQFCAVQLPLDFREFALGIGPECLEVFRSIMVIELCGAVEDVVRHVVCLPELVALDDTYVHSVPDGLVAVILVVTMRRCLDLFVSQRLADIEMHIALCLSDADDYAVGVLTGLLHIFLGT